MTRAKSHSHIEAHSGQPSSDGTGFGGEASETVPTPKDVVEKPNPETIQGERVEPTTKTNTPEIPEVPVGTGEGDEKVKVEEGTGEGDEKVKVEEGTGEGDEKVKVEEAAKEAGEKVKVEEGAKEAGEKAEVERPESPAQITEPEMPEDPVDTEEEKEVDPKSLADRSMVSREDQRNLKEAKDMGKKKPRRKNEDKEKGGKGAKAFKRPAARAKAKAKPEAAAKAKGKGGKKQEGSDEESREDDIAQATQFYSPIRPKDLDPSFEQVDDCQPKKRPSTRTSKAKRHDPAASAGGSQEPPQKRPRKESNSKTEVKEDKTQPKGSKRKSSGQERVSFAGRVAPKSEKARQRFNIMVATYNTKIRQFVDCNNSHFEAGFSF